MKKSRNDLLGKIRRTLYLSKLPSNMRNSEAIKDYFDAKYPGSNVKLVRVNFELSAIPDLEKEHGILTSIVDKCSNSSDEDEERLINKRACSSCCDEGDFDPPLASDHYQRQREEIGQELNTRVKKILENMEKVDSAFVQVESLEIARQIGN